MFFWQQINCKILLFLNLEYFINSFHLIQWPNRTFPALDIIFNVKESR